MNESYSRLPWNEDLEGLLLYCIVAKGGHLCHGKKNSSQIWNSINDMFFEQPELQEHKGDHYKQGQSGFRKLREKYVTLVAAIEKDMESGNLSAKSGDDLNDKYKYAKQILEEKAAKLAEKEAGLVLKQKLNDTEKELLAQSGPLKRKLIDGTVVDNTKKNRKAPPSFEETLLQIVTSPAASTVSDQSSKEQQCGLHADEEAFEVKFSEWISDNGRTLQELIHSARINNEDVIANLVELGMNTLISIYCTRNANFSATVFKKELREMEFTQMTCSKLYCALQEWRREYELFKRAKHYDSNGGGEELIINADDDDDVALE